MPRSLSARAGVLITLLGAAVTAPGSAHAQARTQITPFFTTFFAPLPYAKDVDQTGAGDLADERMTTAPGLGLRVSFPLATQIGIEAQVAYVTSGRQAKIDVSTGTAGFFLTGNAVLVSGRVTYHPRRSNFRGILGAAFEQLGGDAWDSDNVGGEADKSSIGGILGFGVRANVTPRLALDVSVESFLHSSDPAGNNKKQFQADVLLSLGVPIGLGH